MSGYSGTPLWKKLGFKSGLVVFIENEPDDYRSLLGLPAEIAVTWRARLSRDMEFIHIFSRESDHLRARLELYRTKLKPDGVLWVSWPKKSSGVETDITEGTIRDIAIPLGLVDIKVCAIDSIWSGLKLMIRRTER